jgi:hypothetical protein
MYKVQRTGRISDVIAEVRDVPARQIPYATSIALTRVARLGQAAVVQAMPRVLDRPVAYTLNATRVVPATVKTLAAQVAVKDETTNNGNLPEDYLFPEVFGGPRKEKRFERSLRFAGILKAGQRVVPGQDAPLDSFGNIKPGELQRILTATRSASDPYQRRTNSKRSQRNAKNAPYFVAGLDSVSIRGGEQVIRRGRIQPGIYRREGRSIKPVLIFVSKAPEYRRRLDFAGLVDEVAQTQFRPEFLTALQSLNARWS